MSAGDTNKFLREDCHLALDAMVENLSPARVIAVITTEDVLNHKNPTVRYGDSQPSVLVCSRSEIPKLWNMGTLELNSDNCVRTNIN